MKTFRAHRSRALENPEVRTHYNEEKELLDLAIRMCEARKKAAMSQKQLAESAHVTQQQVSKVENGHNCNIMTYLKVAHAIGLEMNMHRQRKATHCNRRHQRV
jgi:DNA-binding XRE family transcriptional regulator